MRAGFGLVSLVLPRVSPFSLFLHVLQGIAGAIDVSNFLFSIPNGFFEFLVLGVNDINSS